MQTAAQALLALAVAAPFAGCSGSDEKLLGAYLEELEFNAPLEAAAYVPLGKFEVPAAAIIKASGSAPARTLCLGVSFQLLAETAPENEAAVVAAAAGRQGALNDALINIIRTSSTDELTDPRLSAVKLRMTEVARPLLGGMIRQLVIDDIKVAVL